MSRQSHRSDPRVLDRRTLERDHRGLAELLRPGLAVLDIGCGTGAITAGIAKAVGAQGFVVGVDRDEAMLDIARRQHEGLANLTFATADATCLPFQACFDVVTAARALQWISEAGAAIAQMKRAAKPRGRVIALDYNHDANEWQPQPPARFHTFYRAFLGWRSANGWDNRMGDHLPDLFRSAGLMDIATRNQDEVVQRGDPDFPAASAVWSRVIDSIGPRVVEAGLLDERDLASAAEAYEAWRLSDLVRQTLSLRSVAGRVA